MTEPTEADRKAAEEIGLFLKNTRILGMATPETLATIIAKHHAAEREQLAALRKRIHHLEKHNQYFFRCESAWCNPGADSNPALETLKQMDGCIHKAEEELAAERERARRMEEALEKLIAKLDLILPKVDNMCVFMTVHEMPYDGPNLGVELAEARAALEE